MYQLFYKGKMFVSFFYLSLSLKLNASKFEILNLNSHLRGCQLNIYFLSQNHSQCRQNVFTQNHFFYVFE